MFSIRQCGTNQISFLSSLQGRLCLTITGALAVLIVVYGLLAYTELKSDLMNTARETLEAQVLPPVHHSKIEQSVNKQELEKRANLLTSTLSLHGVKCIVFDSQGKPFSPRTGSDLKWSFNYRTDKNSFLIEDQNPHLAPQLVYVVPIRNVTGESEGIYLVTWSSLGHVMKSLHTEGIFLSAGGLLALALAFFIIYILTGLMLHPLNNLVETSRAVAANDLSVRVPETNIRDELAYLTSVFNQMLDRLQDSFNSREQALNLIKKYVADISHEFRSPLTSINGYIDIWHRGAVNDPIEQERVYSSIKREISRLSRLVENILTLARLDSRMPGDKCFIDVYGLINESAQRAQMLDPERKIMIETEEDCIVLGEYERLQQMVNNLVDNALYHSGTDAAITLGCKREKDTIKMWVKDNGTGISKEEIPFVFGRFWRSPSSSTTRGSGLGLSIVKAIAENHGGWINVESIPGQGANFIVTLPGNSCEE